MAIAATICKTTKYMFDVRGGHVRGRGKKGMRHTGLSSLEEVIVVVSFNIFHLCGMVSRDTGAFDRQSENAFFCVYIISIPITKNVGIATTK